MIKNFFFVLGLLVITIPSAIFAAPTNYLNCEQIFRTSECSTCQKTLYELGAGAFNSGIKLSQCPASLNLGVIIAKEYEAYNNAGYNSTMYDLEPAEKGFYKYCEQEYYCNQEEIDIAVEKIEKDCADELDYPLDLSADPRTLGLTVLATRRIFLSYYTGFPSCETICLKNENEGLCSVDLLKNLVEYVKNISNGTYVVLTLDGKSLIFPNGTRLSIPQDLDCNECGAKIAKINFDFWTEHRLNPQLEQNFFGGYNKLKYDYDNRCKNDNTKRNVIGGEESKRDVEGGVAHSFYSILPL